MRIIICYSLCYLFLFSLHFVFLPIRIRTILALYGLFHLYHNFKYISLPKTEKKKWRSLLHIFLLFMAVVFVSTIINLNFDAEYYKYPIKVIISFTSAYGLLKIIQKLLRMEINQHTIIKLIIIVTVIECILTVMLHLIPSLKNVLFGLLNVSDLAAYAIEKEEFNRMTGLGAKFFSGGVFMALGIFYVSLMINRLSGIIRLLGLFLALLLILLVGSAIARTTLVGVLGFIIVFFMPSKGKSFLKSNKIQLLFLFFLFSLVSYRIYIYYIEQNPLFEVAAKRAFSIVYTYQETGEMQSKESMVGDYTVPDNMKTWIIGDAQMADPKDPVMGRYKGIDIGIWEFVWGYGIIGLVLYSLIQFYFCKLAGFRRIEYWTLFVMYIIFMNKGPVSYDLLLSLFIMLPIYNSIEKNKLRYSHQSIISTK